MTKGLNNPNQFMVNEIVAIIQFLLIIASKSDLCFGCSNFAALAQTPRLSVWLGMRINLQKLINALQALQGFRNKNSLHRIYTFFLPKYFQ